MTIKKFQVPLAAVGRPVARGILENEVSFGDMTVLETNHGSDKGWADNVLYDFHLDFNLVPERSTSS